MTDTTKQATAAAIGRIIQLEEEVEASGHASTEGTPLAFARAALHAWVDSAVGVVASPGLGRVTLIHANGVRSSIASPTLPFSVSMPVGRKQSADD